MLYLCKNLLTTVNLNGSKVFYNLNTRVNHQNLSLLCRSYELKPISKLTKNTSLFSKSKQTLNTRQLRFFGQKKNNNSAKETPVKIENVSSGIRRLFVLAKPEKLRIGCNLNLKIFEINYY
jgi:hypothetical protein